jgi:histone acetyltransferase (RNA polymerase elongator complex component)
MLGLPGDNYDFARLTAEKAVKAEPDFVRIYPVLVLKNTTLAKWYGEGKYKPWSLESSVEMAAYWLGLFSLNHIPVIRIGLNTSENLSPDRDLVAGPYHPAFGELVESRLMLEQITSILDREKPRENSHISISFHPHSRSKVTGQKKYNLEYLRKRYGVNNISLIPRDDLEKEDIVIENSFRCTKVKRQDFLEKYRI